MNNVRKPSEALQRLETIIDHYISSLEGYSIEQLWHQSRKDRWSLGQMYVHLIYAALDVYFPSILSCIRCPDNEAVLKTEAGNIIFREGEYPPDKVKTTHKPQNPKDKQALEEGLELILTQARELLPIVEDSSTEDKFIHPRLGALNAMEWFALAEMHMRHHLLQKKELEGYLHD